MGHTPSRATTPPRYLAAVHRPSPIAHHPPPPTPNPPPPATHHPVADFTGSDHFNRSMRWHAKNNAKGHYEYTLSDHGLYVL